MAKGNRICGLGLMDGDVKELPSYINMDALKSYLKGGEDRPVILAIRLVNLDFNGTYDEDICKEPKKLEKDDIVDMIEDDFSDVTYGVQSNKHVGYRCLEIEKEKRDPNNYEKCQTCPFYVDAGVLKLLTEKK